MGDIKQTNFRVNEDTADAFRKFCAEQGISQAQGFDHAMDVLKLDQAKGIVPERKIEIEDFEMYVKKILEAYLKSLEINANAEKRAKEQFAGELSRREHDVDELRNRVDQLQAEKDAAEAAAASAVTAKEAAEKKEKDAAYQIDALKKSAAEKDRIVCILNSRLSEKEQMLVEYANMVAIKQEHEKKIQELEQELGDMKKDRANEIATLKKDAEMEQERAITAKERELSVKVQEAELKAARLAGKLEMLEARIKELTTDEKK